MADSPKLTPDERTEQIRRHEGHMILEAGAGTGKTYSLTERVIHQLVERKVPLERMLALTFTDFAAAEMRTRIYKAINGRLRESSPEDISTEHLQTTRRRFSKNYISTFHSFCNRILQYFPDELTGIEVTDQPLPDQPETGRRSDPAAAGEPEASHRQKTDSAILQPYGRLSTRNVEGSFELLSDYDEVLRMIEWRKAFYSKYKAHPGLQRQLTRLTVSNFEKFMALLGGLEDHALREMVLLDPHEYIALIERLAKIWQDEKNRLESSLLAEFESHPEWFRPDKRPGTFDDLVRSRTKSGTLKKSIFDQSAIDPEELDDVNSRTEEMFQYAEALDQITVYLAQPELLENLQTYPDQEDFHPDHEAYWNMRDLAELALRWNTLIRYQRFQEGYFNYDDMIWLTHTLFVRNPSVVRQMRHRFDQILVDEFQDTDRRQWDIIRKLGFGEKEGESSDKEVLIVGDVKQAIYAFRGGDVAMMQQAHSDLSNRPGNAPEIVPLEYSFRSNPAIIIFSNRLFRDILGRKAEITSYEAAHQPLSLPPAKLSAQADAPGEVRLFRTGYNELKKHKKEWSVAAESLAGHMAMLESRRIAHFLRQIYDGKVAQYERITEKMRAGQTAVGILFRRRKYFYAMEQALEEAGVPSTVAKGASFYERREVRDAWLLLAFLLDAYDDVSLTGVLRSPMVSLSDSGLLAIRVAMDDPARNYPNFWSAVTDHKSWSDSLLHSDDQFVLTHGIPFLQELRKQVPVTRVSELVEQAFFNDGPWFGAYAGDAQVRENLVKLLDVIRKLESSGRGTLYEITGFLADRIREEAKDSEAEHPDPAPVQLMTIHGSKGLQFPMVVIPDMYAGLNEGGVQLNIAASDDDSIAWPALAYKTSNRESEDESNDSFLNRVLKKESRKRSIAELKRLFYVAVTRAETHLLMSMSKPKGSGEKGTFAEMIRPWLAREEDAGPGPGNSGDDSGRDSGEVVIEDLSLEELERLAAAGHQKMAGKKSVDAQDKADIPDKLDTQEKSDVLENANAPDKPDMKARPHILDRDSAAFGEADREVSAEIVTASGATPPVSVESESAPEPGSSQIRDTETADSAPPGDHISPRWKSLTPADAGTLIHRTLEMGITSSSTPPDTFWERELLRMGYPDPAGTAAHDQHELWRHCQNAEAWIGRTFGEPVLRRYEVAFEVKTREEGKTVTVRGSIDLILTDRDGNDHVIDFKTGPVDSDALQQHVTEYGYDRQVAVYRQAYKELTGQDIPVSQSWLLFTWPENGVSVRLDQRNQG